LKNRSFAAGIAIVAIANVFALVHAARNRAGVPDATLTVTDRELAYSHFSNSSDNSGVTLGLRWTAPDEPGTWGFSQNPNWLDKQKLQAFGFDCHLDAAAADAQRFYQHQQSRRIFVALEYDGPAWQAWSAAHEEFLKQQANLGRRQWDNSDRQSHLVSIDANRDAARLRRRYPDRARVVIANAVVSIYLDLSTVRGGPPYPSNANIRGRLDLESSIHVPRPYSEAFQRWLQEQKNTKSNDASPAFTARLRYGSLLEPWVERVEFGQ
jgi:hypothetical protein